MCRADAIMAGGRGIVMVFLTMQSCIFAGTDVRRPPPHGSSALSLDAPCLASTLGLCAAVNAGHVVARLRGGCDEAGGSNDQSVAKPATKSWADRLRQPSTARSASAHRSRTPSVNVAAGDAPLPAGIETAGGMQAQRIPMEMLADMDLNADGEELDDVEDNGGNIMPFMTDVEIREMAAKQQGPGTNAGKDRDLEPFVCDDELHEGRLEDDPDAELDARKRVKGFDQFKINEDKFGIKTDAFNQDDYTAPIDKSDPAYAEQVQCAELLAAEIQGSWNAGGPTTMSNMHVRDERNLPLPDDLDEATLYSTVNPHRPADPVAGQLMGEDCYATRSSQPRSAAPPSKQEEAEGEEMKSEELEEVLQDAYERYVTMIENNDPLPPEVEKIRSTIQVALYNAKRPAASASSFPPSSFHPLSRSHSLSSPLLLLCV